MPGKLILNSGKWTPRTLLKKKRKFPAETLNLSIINHIFLSINRDYNKYQFSINKSMLHHGIKYVFLYSSLSNRFSQTFLRFCSLAFLLKCFSVTEILRVDPRFSGGGIKCTQNCMKFLKVGQEGRVRSPNLSM